jgi:hypothetical protein
MRTRINGAYVECLFPEGWRRPTLDETRVFSRELSLDFGKLVEATLQATEDRVQLS